MRNLLLLCTSIIIGGLGYAYVASPVDPLPWQPPQAPQLAGVLAPNEALKSAEIIGAGQVDGPEDVDVDPLGRVYGGLVDGRIVRIDSTGQVETFVNTGGRPLGLAFDAAGNLIVADAVKGLLMVEPDGKITTLVTEVGGVPLGFTDDVDIADDGSIYFSDASTKWGVWDYKMDALEMRPSGRLIRYVPATGKTEVLLDKLYFANGVAVSKNQDFVVVNETWAYRVTRYWLHGPKAGQSDVLADNLPGFPDGISSGRAADNSGVFWIALFTPRNTALDLIQPYPWIKRIEAKLPTFLQPHPEKYGLVLAIDESGKPLRTLHDTDGRHLYEVTSVQQSGEWIYFGSLHNDRIGRLRLNAALPAG